MTRLRSPGAFWATGIRLGMALLPRQPVAGLKKLILPVSYWRAVEFAYTGRQLGDPKGLTILDIGSPKEFAAAIAGWTDCRIVATDILQSAVEQAELYRDSLRSAGRPARIEAAVQDGRALTYDDHSFDVAVSVSVLEHIPDDGDSRAMGELVRVVRPGGRIIITVPYAPRYRETFVSHQVYEREQQGSEPVFFERHYDAETLRSRLLFAPNLSVENLELWGERIPLERTIFRPPLLRKVLSPLECPLAALNLAPIPEGSSRLPMAAFVTLRRL